VRGLAHTEQQVLPEKEQQQQQQQHQQQLHSTSHSAGFSPPPPLTGLEKLGLYGAPTSAARNFSSSDPAVGLGAGLPMLSPFSPSPIPNYEPPLKLPQLPHMPHISFNENQPPPIDHRTSPQPRRKQVNCTQSFLIFHIEQKPTAAKTSCIFFLVCGNNSYVLCFVSFMVHHNPH